MATRRWNITHLLENGGRIIPWKLIFDYRYNKTTVGSFNQAYVNVYVTLEHANPVNLIYAEPLYIPTENECGMSKFTTEVFAVPSDKNATGAYLEIVNAENLELKRISLAFNSQGILPSGDTTAPFADLAVTSLVINDGSIFTAITPVTVYNIVNKPATHYKISRYSDFRDASWVTYAESALFNLFAVGTNRIYFKVKSATEESASVYAEVGWDGQILFTVTETVTVGSVTVSDVVEIELLDEYEITMSDTVTIVDVVVTDPVDDSVLIEIT